MSIVGFFGLFSLLSLLSLLSLATGCTQTVALDETGELVTENLVVGTGESMPTDSVVVQATVRLTGRVLGSTEIFSQTQGTSENVAFNAGKMPSGYQSLDSVMRGMRVGGKRRVTVPPRFGFGITDFPGVPKNSTLVLEVELLGIQRLRVLDELVGTGDTANLGKSLLVYYTGRLSNGQVFDRSPSASNSSPFQFQLGAGKVILGWDVGMRGMITGGRRVLTIPPALGYGAAGSSRNGVVTIPANATLTFEVELLQVN
jgi:FKBP-type peptidyl-prolyl cis-trans isomerase